MVRRLPADLPLGYHRLVRDGAEQLLIAAPRRCAPPPADRAWGWTVQLPALRSSQSWGMGDLADLRELCEWSDAQGARFVLVNPLGASRPSPEPEASPYSPSSRRFRSPLYLRVEEVPGAERVGTMLADLSSAGRALNANPAIERARVLDLKQRALEAIWGSGAAVPAADRAGLEAFRAAVGDGLRDWALYLSLSELHGADWRHWPAGVRSRDPATLDAAARDAAPRIAFHEWVQWLIDEQLARAGRSARVVTDLPVGFDPGGFDAWAWQPILAHGVSLGAAPDPFNPLGQDWGLPPFAPDRLRAVGYLPLIETLRAAFRHAGGLRVDHALGLFRQWWIPAGSPPAAGAFMPFPAAELLAVLAIESVRAGAPVIGEDLGTAAPGARRAMARAGILSTRVAYFERRIADLPDLALAVVSTHDLPTLAGSWTGRDTAELRDLGLPDAARAAVAFRRRLARLTGLGPERPAREAIIAAHRAIAEGPTRLAAASLEDALEVIARPNLPGTPSALRANWSRALPRTLEQLRTDPFPRLLARTMAIVRPPGALNRA